jgi:hypothetical protein
MKETYLPGIRQHTVFESGYRITTRRACYILTTTLHARDKIHCDYFLALDDCIVFVSPRACLRMH